MSNVVLKAADRAMFAAVSKASGASAKANRAFSNVAALYIANGVESPSLLSASKDAKEKVICLNSGTNITQHQLREETKRGVVAGYSKTVQALIDPDADTSGWSDAKKAKRKRAQQGIGRDIGNIQRAMKIALGLDGKGAQATKSDAAKIATMLESAMKVAQKSETIDKVTELTKLIRAAGEIVGAKFDDE